MTNGNTPLERREVETKIAETEARLRRQLQEAQDKLGVTEGVAHDALKRATQGLLTAQTRNATRTITDPHTHSVFGGGGGGLVHYDMVVDSNWTGAAGATVTIGTGATTRMYKTLQAAITAADADNTARSILVNAGTYTENITIAGTVVHPLLIQGEARDSVTINGTLDINAQAPIFIDRITVMGATSAGLSNVEVHWKEVEFTGSVAGDFADSTWDDCVLTAGFDIPSPYTPDNCYFSNCRFDGVSTWGNGLATSPVVGLFFDNCEWTVATPIQNTSAVEIGLQDIVFQNCTTQGAGPFFHVNHASSRLAGIVFDGCGFTAPTDGVTAPVYVQAANANSRGGIIVSNCTFAKTTDGTSTIHYVRCDTANVPGWVIVGNSFRRGGASNDYAEDDVATSVRGIFVDSVIGPNSPADFNIQADAGTSGTLHFGTGVVSGAGLAGVTSVPGATGLTVEEDNVAVTTNTTSIDFAEPDGTLVTGGGTAEAEVNMALYAKLAGRSGGQTLIGGTATGERNDFVANSVDSATRLRLIPSADSGTANAAVTTTNTTLTDTREAWLTNQWINAVVTCNGKTMTVTSNTATVLTGASWSGGGNPGNGFAWSIAGLGGWRGDIGTEANARWVFGFTSGTLSQLVFGAGGVLAPDMAFQRASNSTIQLRRLNAAAAPSWDGIGSTDTQPRWRLGAAGLQFGPGGATAVDTTLARVSAGLMRATNYFELTDITSNPGAAATTTGRVYVRSTAGSNPSLFYQNDSDGEIGPIGRWGGTYVGGVPNGTAGFSVSRNTIDIDPWGFLEGHAKTFTTEAVDAPSGTAVNPGYRQGTAASVGSVAGLQWGLNLNATAPWIYAFKLSDVTNTRMFIGFSDQTLATMVGADDPAGNYTGIQLRVGDTDWFAVSKDGTTLNRQDTLVAASSTSIFGIRITGNGTIVTLVNDTGQSLGSVTLAANFPTGTLRLVAGIESRSASIKEITHYWAHVTTGSI